MKNFRKILAVVLSMSMALSLLAGCGSSDDTSSESSSEESTDASGSSDDGSDLGYTITEFDENETYTYNGYVASLTPNWNPLDYEESTAADYFIDYLTDSFYVQAFNDELHPMDDETREAYDGYVYIPAMAADYPVDITEQVKAEHPEWFDDDAADSGYAYAITLRDDLYFDTGYHITAETYVQSAQYLLDPDLLNYRSTDIYNGSTGIVGAEAYFKQGTVDYIEAATDGITVADMVAGDDGTLTYTGVLASSGVTADSAPVYIAVDYALEEWMSGNSLKEYVDAYGEAYFGLDTWDELVALMDEEGLVPATEETLALLSGVTTTNANWGETDDDLYNYLVIKYEWPDNVSFDTVGIYALDEYTLVEVFKGSVSGFSLYYNGIKDYLFLVEPDVYESCLTIDEAGNAYSTYMTSVETSPSYGPYSMSEYQTDKMVHYVQNEYYYGYHDDVNHVYLDPEDGNVYRMFQTTDIDFQVISEMTTAKQMFLAGELITYSMQAEDYEQYGFSDYLYSSPGASIYFFLLTGDLDGLQAREAASDFDTTQYDLETITVTAFRKALAVSFDKQAFCDEVSPATTPGYGIFGDTIIYDPETAGFYRDTDQAKQALVDFYSVDVSQYSSLDEAVDSITGYDPETAKEFFTEAFYEALELGYITDDDNDGISDQTIQMEYVITSLTDTVQKRIEWLNTNLATVLEGTPFEGKVTIVASAPYESTAWATAIKTGQGDLILAGWTGSQMDPYGLLTAYTWPSYAYAANWYDPTSDMLTLTIDGEEITLSVYDWAEAVNGTSVTSNGVSYNFGEGQTTQDNRLTILAGVEGALLQTYTYLPFTNAGSKFLLSQKVYYVVEDYNPVMARGGIQYMKYNYSDSEWETYVAEQIAANGQLQY